MMRRGARGKAVAKSTKSGGHTKGKMAQGKASSRPQAKKDEQKQLPRTQLDVYEDSSDGEGNAAFYSHIDEGARPDTDSMDAASRRRFKTTMVEDDDEDDVFEDDEEIDEDEAFDEEDEKRYGEVLSTITQRKGTTKKDKPTKKHKARELTLSESESDEEGEEDDDEGEDLEDAEEDGEFKRLDEMFDELEEEEAEEGKGAAKGGQEDAYEHMMAVVQGDKKKAKKRTAPSDEAHIYPEGEFNLHPSAAKGKLTLDALMGSLKDEVAYADVKKQLTELRKTKDLLAKPLDQPVQQKLTREEAYHRKKDELTDTWETTVRRNRTADYLKFPFAEAPAQKLTTAALAHIDKPANSLEQGIADILAQSGVAKKDIDTFEGLAMKDIDPDQVAEREAQIKKMKAVLFYEEAKAKRRKKIKSKAYHRILKKQKQKATLSLDELEQVDEDAARAEVEKMERERIQERITQRHKNKGKWAQRQLGRAHMSTETRQAISEQIRIRDQLLKKQMALDGGEDGDLDDMDEEQLQEALEQLEKEEAPQVVKGVMGMEFMKRGQKRRAEHMQQTKEAWEQDMEEMIRQRDLDSDAEEAQEAEPAEVQGRRKVQNTQVEKAAAGAPAAPVKFSGATQQTEKAALSSGRTVKMSGHITIDMPAALKKGTAQQQQPAEIVNMFAVEEFPEVDDGPVHDINQKQDAVAAILKEDEEEEKAKKQKKPTKKQQQQQKKKDSTAAPSATTTTKSVPSALMTEAEDEGDDDDDDEAAPPRPKGPLSVAHVQAPAGLARPVPVEADDEEAREVITPAADGEDDDGVQAKRAPRPAKAPRLGLSNPEVPDMENPWMKRSEAATGVVAKKAAHTTITASHAGTTADDKVSKTQKKTVLGKRQKAELTLKLDTEKLITDIVSTQTKEHDDDDRSSETRGGAGFNLLASASEEQKELIKRAFANDDVVEEFKAAKRKEEDEDAPPPPKPTVMPGWGDWVGEGVVKKEKKEKRPPKQPRLQKPKRPNELPAKPPTRSDEGLDHVIINQKRDKKFARYQADQLPTTYRKQPELYEAQLQTPLGREWNTQRIFDKVTRPRIELKKGHIIRPISEPIGKKQKREKTEDKGEPVTSGGPKRKATSRGPKSKAAKTN